MCAFAAWIKKMTIDGCQLILSPEQEEQQPWRCLDRYLLLQTSFVALTRKTEPISASHTLWENLSLSIMTVALFNPQRMQSITGGHLTFSIVRFLWKMPCLKQPLEGGACAERQGRSFHLWVPSSIFMPCAPWFGDRNLLQEEPQGLAVYPHKETMSKVETTNSSVWWQCYEPGYFCCMENIWLSLLDWRYHESTVVCHRNSAAPRQIRPV